MHVVCGCFVCVLVLVCDCVGLWDCMIAFVCTFVCQVVCGAVGVTMCRGVCGS